MRDKDISRCRNCGAWQHARRRCRCIPGERPETPNRHATTPIAQGTGSPPVVIPVRWVNAPVGMGPHENAVGLRPGTLLSHSPVRTREQLPRNAASTKPVAKDIHSFVNHTTNKRPNGTEN